MPFVLNEEKKVWWPITVDEPANKGKTTRRKFELEFIIENPEDWGEPGTADEEKMGDVLSRVVTGWKNVTYEDGTEVEFSTDNLMRLIKPVYVFSAVWQAYTQEVILGAPAKN